MSPFNVYTSRCRNFPCPSLQLLVAGNCIGRIFLSSALLQWERCYLNSLEGFYTLLTMPMIMRRLVAMLSSPGLILRPLVAGMLEWIHFLVSIVLGQGKRIAQRCPPRPCQVSRPDGLEGIA